MCSGRNKKREWEVYSYNAIYCVWIENLCNYVYTLSFCTSVIENSINYTSNLTKWTQKTIHFIVQEFKANKVILWMKWWPKVRIYPLVYMCVYVSFNALQGIPLQVLHHAASWFIPCYSSLTHNWFPTWILPPGVTPYQSPLHECCSYHQVAGSRASNLCDWKKVNEMSH